MRHLILILSLLSVYTIPSQANEQTSITKNPAYQTGVKAANCAGLYEFLTILYKVKRDPARINNAMTESKSWRETTKASFTEAGLKRVQVIVQTDEIVEKERQRYLYFMESTPKHLPEEIETGLAACSAQKATGE